MTKMNRWTALKRWWSLNMALLAAAATEKDWNECFFGGKRVRMGEQYLPQHMWDVRQPWDTQNLAGRNGRYCADRIDGSAFFSGTTKLQSIWLHPRTKKLKKGHILLPPGQLVSPIKEWHYGHCHTIGSKYSDGKIERHFLSVVTVGFNGQSQNHVD